jgi:hypothetical protein
MRLKPVDLGPAEGSIHQAYHRHPFPLSRPAMAKSSAQHGQNTNTPTNSDRLHLNHLSNDLEVHQEAFLGDTEKIQLTANAQAQPLPEAGAERTLEAVGCSGLLSVTIFSQHFLYSTDEKSVQVLLVELFSCLSR